MIRRLIAIALASGSIALAAPSGAEASVIAVADKTSLVAAGQGRVQNLNGDQAVGTFLGFVTASGSVRIEVSICTGGTVSGDLSCDHYSDEPAGASLIHPYADHTFLQGNVNGLGTVDIGVVSNAPRAINYECVSDSALIAVEGPRVYHSTIINGGTLGEWSFVDPRWCGVWAIEFLGVPAAFQWVAQ